MKPQRGILLWSVLLLAGHLAAQCGTCTPDTTCLADPPFPTVCPSVAPQAQVGVPYDEQLTFWIPPVFTDPNTGFSVSVQEVRVTSVTGVPLGLSYETDAPDQVYFPQIAPHGCVRVCGIPLFPGSFTASVTVDADVLVGSIPLTVPQSLGFSLTVVPGSGGNSGFSFSPPGGCAPLTVDLQALITGAGLLPAYTWSFPGGTATGPQLQLTLETPGITVVDLHTELRALRMERLTVNSVNTAWCGDIEEPSLLGQCIGAPDLFFTWNDAAGNTFTAPIDNDAFSTSWNDLEVLLNAPPYRLTLIDKDPFFDGDDTLGVFTLSPDSAGVFTFAQGATQGSFQVALFTVQSFDNQDSIAVLPPFQPNLQLDPDANSLCVDVVDPLSVSWSLNGAPYAASGPCVPALNGLWSVTVVNAQGCTATLTGELPGVGVNELPQALPRMYPQPAAERVTLVWDLAPGPDAVLVGMDAQGRVWLRHSLAGLRAHEPLSIDLHGVAAGVHVLHIQGGTGQASWPVVVSP
jgi:hypothetical protein